MPGQTALGVYLTDHMAGSISASDLAKRGARNNTGEVAQFFTDVGREIETDRRTLKQVAARVDARPNPAKQALAVAAERISRFKIDHRMTGSAAMSLLLELELLYLGIDGKRELWRALRARAAADSRLSEFDFDKLIRRAEDQLAMVEDQRLAIATTALAA